MNFCFDSWPLRVCQVFGTRAWRLPEQSLAFRLPHWSQQLLAPQVSGSPSLTIPCPCEHLEFHICACRMRHTPQHYEKFLEVELNKKTGWIGW